MLKNYSAPDAATSTACGVADGSPSAPPSRVTGIAINDSTFKTIANAAQRVAVLWGVLDRCVVPAEQRAQALGGGSIPSALEKIDIKFPPWPRPIAPILGPLTTDYPMVVRSLKALSILYNDYDESAVLGAFAALATQLHELTLRECGLTSLRGLEGRCEHLQNVDVSDCKNLISLDGVGDRVHLQTINASGTPITAITPLQTCPALTTVHLFVCEDLSSLEGLEDHQQLREVNAPATPVASIEPLRSCPALTHVNFNNCRRLDSIEPLEQHRHLRVVNAASTFIASVESLRTCPALTNVNVDSCRRLSSIEPLENHKWLQVVQVSWAPMLASIEPLRTCPALTKVDVRGCQQLAAVSVDWPATVEIVR